MKVVVFSCLLALHACAAARPKSDLSDPRFPEDFLFGTASAAYQNEGAWDADDKGESIWDHLAHNYPEMIEDGTNADIGADSYHNYKRDVEMMRELGIDANRFSVSWPRILPDGFSNRISEAGVAFYNSYIDEMLKYNITPMLTLYHWDLPQRLQLLGGWANPLIADWFEDYARVVYATFGDRVKIFIPINEPQMICEQGYGDAAKAPAEVNMPGIANYMCTKNLLLAHARAYHLYNDEFKATQGGTCGIAINTNWFEPWTDSEADVAAAELMRQADWGLYADPIFSQEGNYGINIRDAVAAKSAAQGYPRSRLPELTPEEVDYIRGSADFYGANHYTTIYVYSNESSQGIHNVPSSWDDMDIQYIHIGVDSASPWLKLVDGSLYKTLAYLDKNYDRPVIHITENGWSSGTGLLDEQRVAYYREHLAGVLGALAEGIQVKSFMAWSLMDNMEWLEGLTPRLGLYEVDYADPARTRTPRKSAFVYKEIARSRVVDPDYEPGSLDMTIDEGH